MRRLVAAAVLLVVVTAGDAARRGGEGMQPIAGAEGERRVAETRDFLTDLLWQYTEVHWHEGRWEEVIDICRRVIELDPQFVEAYTGAAWMLWSMDRDEEAIALYRAGIAANPTRYEIHHDFGMYYLHRQKWGPAVEEFRRSVELAAPMYYQHMLPNALERAGRKAEALAEWRAILERFPEDPVPGGHIEELERELKGE